MARTKSEITLLAELANTGDVEARKLLEAFGAFKAKGALFSAEACAESARKLLKAHRADLTLGEIRGELAAARLRLLETAAENPSPGVESDLRGIFAASLRNIRKGKEKVPGALSPEGEAIREILLSVAPNGSMAGKIPPPKDD